MLVVTEFPTGNTQEQAGLGFKGGMGIPWKDWAQWGNDSWAGRPRPCSAGNLERGAPLDSLSKSISRSRLIGNKAALAQFAPDRFSALVPGVGLELYKM